MSARVTLRRSSRWWYAQFQVNGRRVVQRLAVAVEGLGVRLVRSVRPEHARRYVDRLALTAAPGTVNAHLIRKR